MIYDKEEKQERPNILSIRLSECERDMLNDEAKRRGKKISEYMRYAGMALIGGHMENKAREQFRRENA